MTATVNAGKDAQSIGVNPITNKIYIVNAGDASVTVIDGATNNTKTITIGGFSLGTFAAGIAVDPTINKIYVAKNDSNQVAVIDGNQDAVIGTIGVGTTPTAIALNPITGKIYVANTGSGSITVIDSNADSAISTLRVGINPVAVAVNVATNQVFVASQGSNDITIIAGGGNGANPSVTATVSAQGTPRAMALNPVTNQVYAALGEGKVAIIDGGTAGIQTVSAGITPNAVAINPVTNTIYVANAGSNDVTVIDGNNPKNPPAIPAHIRPLNAVPSTRPCALTVNLVTNQVYVADQGSNDVTVIDGATNTATTQTPVGTFPIQVAVNPITNKIYAANQSDGTVTVIDGATNRTTATVLVGNDPEGVALNPVTNKIYVANEPSMVTVIDGATDTPVSTVPVGSTPDVVALNPVTNKIYVPSGANNDVTVIDGATDTQMTVVPVGSNPFVVAVNPVTNKIYVANKASNNVTVIDGATDTPVSVVPVGSNPLGTAVNPVTNKIYVANFNDNTVTVIDGVTNTPVSVISVGSGPVGVAVNPITNKIYVANFNGNTVTIIDGLNDAISIVLVGSEPLGVAVNPVTNKIYVANANSKAPNVTVIDGATDITTTVATGPSPQFVAVNPLTNTIYVTNFSDGTMTVFQEQRVHAIPLTTTITAFPGNVTSVAQPIFTFQAQSSYNPIAPAPQAVYFQLDTWQGPWRRAIGTAPDFNGAPAAPLTLGTHVLYAFAGDGQEATSTGVSSISIGTIQAYLFTVVPPPVVLPGQINTPAGTNVQFSQSAVTLTLAQVTRAGNTSLQLNTASIPPGYRAGGSGAQTRYDLATTAAIAGPVTVCINTPDAMGYIKPNRVRMFLMSASPDPTTGRPPDVTTAIRPSGATEQLPTSFDANGHALPTPLTKVCGQVNGFPADATLSLAVFEPQNNLPNFGSIVVPTPTFLVVTKSQGGDQVSVQLSVAGEQDADASDPCILANQNTTCSDRPHLKTFLFGFFLFSSAPGNNCLAGCDVLDISNPSGDPTATVQMFASTQGAPQQVCVAVVDPTLNLKGVSEIVTASQCMSSANLPGSQSVLIPAPSGASPPLGATSATVTAGQAVSTTIIVAGTSGSSPTFVCAAPAGSPDLAGASISCVVPPPSSVTIPAGNDPATIQLFMQTTARTVAGGTSIRTFPYALFAAPATAILFFGNLRRGKTEKGRKVVFAVMAAMLLVLLLSCGGSTGQSVPNTIAGTPSGTYKIMVTTSNGVTLKPGDGSGPPAPTYIFTLTVR